MNRIETESEKIYREEAAHLRHLAKSNQKLEEVELSKQNDFMRTPEEIYTEGGWSSDLDAINSLREWQVECFNAGKAEGDTEGYKRGFNEGRKHGMTDAAEIVSQLKIRTVSNMSVRGQCEQAILSARDKLK